MITASAVPARFYTTLGVSPTRHAQPPTLPGPWYQRKQPEWMEGNFRADGLRLQRRRTLPSLGPNSQLIQNS